MNKIKKRIFSVLLTLALCLTCAMPTFAAEKAPAEASSTEKTAKLYTFEVNGDAETSVARSSISGYNQKSLTSRISIIEIPVSSSGLGGMGITIKTSCSGNYQLDYIGYVSGGEPASDISGSMSSNDTVEYNGLWHGPGTSEYTLLFGIPQGVSVLVQVWIYG